MVVAGSMSTGFVVSFQNTMADTDWPSIGTNSALTGPVTTINVAETQKGATTSGSWTITFNGSTTTGLPYNALPGDVANAMNALPSVINAGGTVRVVSFTGTTSTSYQLTFMGGTIGNYNWADNIVTANLAPVTPARNEQQRIAFSATPTAGTWSVAFNDGNSTQTSAAIPTTRPRSKCRPRWKPCRTSARATSWSRAACPAGSA